MNTSLLNNDPFSGNHHFAFNCSIASLTEADILKQLLVNTYFEHNAIQQIAPLAIEVNQASFKSLISDVFPVVTVIQLHDRLSLSCTCQAEKGHLCEHEALVLMSVLKREEFSVFFNASLRQHTFKKMAADYGLENEKDLDVFLKLNYDHKKIQVSPKSSGLVPLTKESLLTMSNELLLPDVPALTRQAMYKEDTSVCIVFKRHKYYKYLMVELYKAQTTKEGKLKNPFEPINPLDLIWESDQTNQVKFYTAIAKFQNHSDAKRSESDISALKAIIKNPSGFEFYVHEETLSENITAGSVLPVKAAVLSNEVIVQVNYREPFYELSGKLNINGFVYALNDLTVKFNYFVLADQCLFLVDKLPVLALIDLLKNKPDSLMVHASKYMEFKSQVLAKLEDKLTVQYTYIEEATARQIKEKGFYDVVEKIIYLSDFGNYVMLTPVMKYGEVEIPVRTKRQIYGTDAKDKEFMVKRKEEEEISFIALLWRQHLEFEEQLENDMPYFCLHKKNFLEEEWFLNTFEEWRNNGITVLGFNTIEQNKLNAHKITIDIKVVSGINWFNTIVDAKFGKKKVSVKQLHKSIRNKSKYVQLDDGTLGILPAEWIERFANYFNAGEVVDDDTIRISKVNYSAIDAYYEESMLDEEVKKELTIYNEKLSGFSSIQPVDVPKALQGTLRPYQKHGLNWLNFLDDFNFGGCLADDMGLGKSVQIIAFILSQRTKSAHNTNLLVVPTTLMFNWQAEVQKFAPDIKVLALYGSGRTKNISKLDDYEIILTSYTTLLSDVDFLKEYRFNYIFLDESQNIKNPETQRYKAVRLLTSRNKIAITGTPVENNTFDLYSQLSFACPGLLGSKKYFKDVYSSPIDRFKHTRRAVELQHKVQPFILRRTKQQVAAELPEKNEMVLYCEMQADQRRIYDAYEKEFRDYISATTHDELRKNAMNVLKGLTKLRQICNSPKLLSSGDLSMDEPSSKIAMLMQQVEDKAPQHKILIFSQFVSMLDLIKKELVQRDIRFSYLTGSTRNRQTVVTEFQENEDIKVFLISLKAGGTGLNLTQADHVYIVDPWWNPAVENQAIDRTHRIGQTKEVLAIRLICPGTVEEKIMKMQESKKHLVDSLIKEDVSFLKSLSKDDLLSLFK